MAAGQRKPAGQADAVIAGRPGRPAALCAAIFAIWIGVNAAWLAADHRQPVWDAAFHAANTLDLARTVGGNYELTALQVLSHHIYPPFVYLVSLPSAWVVHQPDGLILWTNLVFGLVLVGSLYGMGRSLGIPWAVPGAALLALCHPVTLFNTRVFLLEFPLAAMVTCAYWRVLESERRWSPRNGALLGVVLGLGLLTKWSFVLYVAPAVAWLGCRLVRTGRLRLGWPVAVAVVATATLICGPWYVWFWQQSLAYVQDNIWESQVLRQDPSGWSVAGWMVYTGRDISVVPFAAWGLAACVIVATGARRARPLLYWFLAGYALLAIAPTVKDIRFFLPLIPLMSLVTWWGLGQLRPDWCRRMVLAGLAVWCVTQVAIQSVPWVDRSVPLERKGWPALFERRHFSGEPALPMPDTSVVVPVMDRLEKQMNGPGRVARALLLTDDRFHGVDTFDHEVSRRRRRLLHIFEGPEQLAGQGLLEVWRRPYDFIVYQDPSVSTHPDVDPQEVRAFGRLLRRSPERYRLVDHWTVDDGGSVVELYVRRPGAAN